MRPLSRWSAFSLIELLAVMAILVILSVVVASIGPGILQGRDLASAREILKGQIQTARLHASSKGELSVVVIRTSGDNAWQRTAVFAADPTTQTWSQVDAWRNLPRRIFVDPNYDPSSEPWTVKPVSVATAHQETPLPAQPLRDTGSPLASSDYVTLAFYPGAGLLSPTNVSIRLAEGRRDGSDVEILGSTSPTRWNKLIVEHVSGQTKELEP